MAASHQVGCVAKPQAMPTVPRGTQTHPPYATPPGTSSRSSLATRRSAASSTRRCAASCRSSSASAAARREGAAVAAASPRRPAWPSKAQAPCAHRPACNNRKRCVLSSCACMKSVHGGPSRRRGPKWGAAAISVARLSPRVPCAPPRTARRSDARAMNCAGTFWGAYECVNSIHSCCRASKDPYTYAVIGISPAPLIQRFAGADDHHQRNPAVWLLSLPQPHSAQEPWSGRL